MERRLAERLMRAEKTAVLSTKTYDSEAVNRRSDQIIDIWGNGRQGNESRAAAISRIVGLECRDLKHFLELARSGMTTEQALEDAGIDEDKGSTFLIVLRFILLGEAIPGLIPKGAAL